MCKTPSTEAYNVQDHYSEGRNFRKANNGLMIKGELIEQGIRN